MAVVLADASEFRPEYDVQEKPAPNECTSSGNAQLDLCTTHDRVSSLVISLMSCNFQHYKYDSIQNTKLTTYYNRNIS